MWPCNYNPVITRPTLHILPVTFDDAFNPIIPSQAPITTSNDIYKSLAKKVVEYYVLQYSLFAYLKFIRWKQEQLIARGIATMQINPANYSFSRNDWG